METLFTILVVLGCLASLANMCMLFFLICFVVKKWEYVKEFFGDLVNMISVIDPGEPIIEEVKPKTWDEKYEEELIERDRRMRAEMGTGLIDLSRPTSNYGVAPAPNPQAQEGLILQSRDNKMR